jgi:hypothetical protein
MSEQRIVGRNGIITVIGGDTPCITGVADPPEDPSRWHSEQIGYDALMRRYGWTTDAQYDEAKILGFPKHIGGINRKTVRWKLEHLRQWDARILNQAAHTPKR